MIAVARMPTVAVSEGARRAMLPMLLALALAVLTMAGLQRGPRADAAAIRVPEASAREHQRLVALSVENPQVATAIGDDALRLNAALPFAAVGVGEARPVTLAGATAGDRAAALTCLTQAIYYEAGFEPLEGRRAVAQVVLNRMRHPAFPHSVCGVVYQGHLRATGCQFSFTCDGALARRPEQRTWAAARQIAVDALDGYVEPVVGTATHYHADYVFPRWAPSLDKLAGIGAHLFYRWPGDWGGAAAFSARYAGGEFVPAYVPRKPAPSDVETTDIVLPEIARLPERRAENDVGGRLDPTKGWTLDIPLPGGTPSALDAIARRQVQDPTVAASPSVAPGTGGQ